MQVSIETTTGLERRMTVGIPAAQIESEVTRRLQEAAKTVRMNGFRKGKIPLKVVKQRFGAGVRQEVIGEVMNRSFYDAVQQEGVNPAGQPSIEPREMAEGKDVEFVATFEVYPEVRLGDLSGFEIVRLTANVQDSDVDNMVETLRKQQASWAEVERAAATGDRVNIDYTGTRDGEEFEGGQASGQDLELGSGSMIPGFEDGIIGMSAGEEKLLSLTFPEDYHAEDLKGAAVEFSIRLNSVSEKVLPELNEEFFAKFGVEGEDEAVFREEVSNNMRRELKNATKNKVKTQVMDKLLEQQQLDLPKALVANEIDALRKQMMQQFGGARPDMDMKSILPDEMFKEQAQRRVSLGLIVAELVRQNDIKADPDRVRELIEETASTYQDPEEVINYYYSNQQLLSSVESAVLEDQVVDHVLASASVTDRECNYEEAIKPAAQED